MVEDPNDVGAPRADEIWTSHRQANDVPAAPIVTY